MASTYVNFDVDQGTDFTITITLTDDLNQVYDLTNHTVSAQMRKNYASTLAITFITSHDDVGGHITLTLDNATTAILAPGYYLYDVELTDAASKITRVIEGIVNVTPGITRI